MSSSFNDKMAEFIVRHDGTAWIAEGPNCVLTAPDSAALDQAILDHLRRSAPADSLPMTAQLRFDTAGLPAWLHQYSGHYFNRMLRVGPERTGDD